MTRIVFACVLVLFLGGGANVINAATDAPWTGVYKVEPSCNVAACCCLEGELRVEQAGTFVTVHATACRKQPVFLTFTLDSPTSTSATFEYLGQQMEAVLVLPHFYLKDQSNPECSVSAYASHDNNNGDSNSNKTAMILAVIGSICLACVIIFGSIYWYNRRRTHRQAMLNNVYEPLTEDA